MYHECISSDSSDDNIEQIPGFYYDKTKKKYFKVQSQALNPGSATTSAAIQKEKAERKMRKLMRRVEIEAKKGKLPQLCSSVQLSGYDNSTHTEIQKLKLHSWTPKPLPYFFTSPPRSSLLTTSGYTFHLTRDTIQIGQLHSHIPGRESVVSLKESLLNFSAHARTDLHMTECMSDVVAMAYTAQPVLISNTNKIYFALAMLSDEWLYNVTHMPTELSCADIVAMCFREGGTVYLSTHSYYGVRCTLWVIRIESPDSYNPSYPMNRHCCCLAAHPSDPNVVYSGSKKGDIYCLDTKTRPSSRKALHRYKQLYKNGLNDRRTRICSILSLNDGVTLAVTHVTGMKSLFDTRMCRPVAYNRETVTDNSCDMSELKQDESGRYLTSSGLEGGFVRIWDARSLETVKVVDLNSNKTCHSDITSRHGSLCLLTCQGGSYNLYS